MSLNPTSWRTQILDVNVAPEVWAQGVASVTIEAGYHDTPDGDQILIDQTRTVRAHDGVVIRLDEEHWTYEVAGSPPLECVQRVSSGAYIPALKVRGGVILIEEVRTRFIPWNTFTDGVNLSKHVVRAGYVLYDLAPYSRTVDAATLAKLEAQGYDVTGAGPLRKVLSSARMLVDGIRSSEVVQKAGTPQQVEWMDPAETTVELVFEQADRWDVYTISKRHYIADDCQTEGPRSQRKEGWSYVLPVPVAAPEVRTRNASGSGVRVEVLGGGAEVPCTWADPVVLRPDRYRIERLTVSETRSGSTDPFGAYDTPPAAAGERSTLWEDTGATGLDGTPVASTQPSQTQPAEPDDPSVPTWSDWKTIAEPENERRHHIEPGRAEVLDSEVVSGGVYRYRAVAVIDDGNESPYSAEVEATYSGATPGRYGFRARSRRAADGSLEVDVLAPDDPSLLDDSYGETLVLDLPVDLDQLAEDLGETVEDAAEELGTDLAQQIMARDRLPGMRATAEIGMPLLGLERGQLITLPAQAWQTTGNGLVISSELQTSPWLLDGFSLSASRSGDSITGLTTTLELVEP